MKTLRAFLNENKYDFRRYTLSDYVGDLYEFYGDDIDYDILENISNNVMSYDFIDENLKSHDYKKLISKLYNKFFDEIVEFSVYDFEHTNDLKSVIISFNKTISLDDIDYLIHSNDFISITEFFNYKVRKFDMKDKYVILEPLFPRKCNDLIEKHNYTAYYFIEYDKRVYDSILTHGIRIKENKSNLYPKRIYMIFPKTGYNFDFSIKSNRHFLEILFGNDLHKDLVMFRIDLREIRNIDIYRDTTMEELAVFTLNNIPAHAIKNHKIIDKSILK